MTIPRLLPKDSSASIRIATAGDIPAIAGVVNAAFEIETFLEGTRTDENAIAQMMRNGEFLVIEGVAGQILASVYIETRGERGYFGMFAVEPSHQSEGIGRRLVEAAENHCHSNGCKFIEFKMLSPRAILLPFYHSLGYRETDTEAFPSSRPVKPGVECHFIRMSKLLWANEGSRTNKTEFHDKNHRS